MSVYVAAQSQANGFLMLDLGAYAARRSLPRSSDPGNRVRIALLRRTEYRGQSAGFCSIGGYRCDRRSGLNVIERR